MRAADGPADGELRRALRRLLPAAGLSEPVEIVRCRCEQSSTFPLECIAVALADETQMRIAFKRLERNRLDPGVSISKPGFAFAAAREPAVYSHVLPLAPAGPPRYLGSLASEGEGRWLFLEWVDGRELHQVGERALWIEAARWLGRLHVALTEDVDRHARAAHLIEHDAAHCGRWVRRAQAFARSDGEASAARFLERLRERYDVVIEALLALPRTVIHGDFYASNVLVAGEGEAVRVAPVDWEMAAVGPGLLDLAALVSGDWQDAEREEMQTAYGSIEGVAPFSATEFDFVRLHHAVQRLGWAPPAWRPPPAQRHDWLAEAVTLAEGLGV